MKIVMDSVVMLKVETLPLEFSGTKEQINEFIESLSSLAFLEEDFQMWGYEDETKILIEPLTIYDYQLLVKQAEKMGLKG